MEKQLGEKPIYITCPYCGTVGEATVKWEVDVGDKRPDLSSHKTVSVWTCNVCDHSWTY